MDIPRTRLKLKPLLSQLKIFFLFARACLRSAVDGRWKDLSCHSCAVVKNSTPPVGGGGGGSALPTRFAARFAWCAHTIAILERDSTVCGLWFVVCGLCLACRRGCTMEVSGWLLGVCVACGSFLENNSCSTTVERERKFLSSLDEGCRRYGR